MRALIVSMFGLCLLASVQTVFASESERSELLHELMERTGLNAQIHQFPEVIEAGVEAAISGSGGDAESAAKIAAIVKHEIEPGKVIDEVGAQLSETMTEADIHALLAWLDSPLGRKIADLESGIPAVADDSAAGSGGATPEVSPHRQELYSRLDDAIRATEATVEMTLNAQVAVASAVLSASNDSPSPSVAWIRERIEAQRFQVRGHITHQVHASFVQTYKALSVTELESYIRQANSPSGRRYTAAVIEALNETLTASFERVGARMSNELLS